MHDDWVYTWLCNMCLPPTLLQHWHITCLMWGEKGGKSCLWGWAFGTVAAANWNVCISCGNDCLDLIPGSSVIVHQQREQVPDTHVAKPDWVPISWVFENWTSWWCVCLFLQYILSPFFCYSKYGLYCCAWLISFNILQASPGPSRLLWVTALPPSFWLNGTRFCVYPTFLSPPVRWWIPKLIPCLRSRELALCCSGIPHGCCECSPSSVPCSWLSSAPIFVEGIFLDHSYGWSVFSSSNSTSSSSVFWIPWFCMSCHSPITCPLFGHI